MRDQEQFSRAVAALGITDAVGEMRRDMRELRTEMAALREDLSETRTTVARIQGRQEGETRTSDRTWRWREHAVSVLAAAGVILGAVATLH